MTPLLNQIYQSTVTKYIKFRRRLDKNISSGKFKHFTRRKQAQLLHKVERLRRRILQLQTQLKLAAAGAALSLFLSPTTAQAQTTTLGPFQRNYLSNPLPPPLPRMGLPAPTFVDLDNDGDRDLIVGTEYNHTLRYFKNIGSSANPFFHEIKSGEIEFPFTEVSNNIPSDREAWAPAFADIDGDGDFDLLVGTDKYSGIGYANTYFFRNIGTIASPNFQFESGAATNPFFQIESAAMNRYAQPTFVDLDKDGDQDLLLGGYYDGATDNYIISYFKNTGTPTAPVYQQEVNSLTASVNNRYSTYRAPNGFADLDQDGDLDFFFSENGTIHYRRNDNGDFNFEYAATNQTGPWVPNVANPGASTGNPFHNINAVIPDNFAFADLDNDGDLDVIVGFYVDNPPYADELRPFLYYENLGQGVFEYRNSLASPVDGIDVGETGSASFADIDNDGDTDIVAMGNIFEIICPDGCYETGRTFTSVLRNNGGTFVDVSETEADKFEDVPVELNDLQMKLIKVDNDNIPDLVAPYYTGTSGAIQYFQLENGVYVERTGAQNPFDGIVIPSRRLNLDLGDLNGDNLPDLILGVADDRLRAYKNTGTAQTPIFTRETSWETGFTSNLYYRSNPTLLDLDNDGDLDIIVGKYDNIWYYENTGTPTEPSFTQYNEFSGLNPFESIDINNTPNPNFFDVDGDGDADLVFGADYGQFQYYENQNIAPVTTVAAADLNGIGGTPTTLDATLSISDTDNDAIVRAIISIQSFQSGNEVLSFTPQAGITGTFNTGTGVLTLTGKATLAAYEAALRTVSYNFTGTVPGGKKSESGKVQSITRTISVQVFDSDFTTPLIRTRSINVAAPNAAPVIVPPTVSTKQGTSVTVNILPSITDTNGNFTASASTLTIVQQPASGAPASLNFVSASVVELTINYSGRTFSGNETLQIQACDALGACTTSTITIQVAPNVAPAIVPQPVSADAGADVTINVLPLITDPDGNFTPSPSTISILQQPTSGASASLVFVSASVVNLLIDYTETTFSGLDQIQIQACDDLGACTTSTISIQVNNTASEIIVYNAFSPNAGDNINSFFHIRHIEVVSPKNKVTIYNRWGDAVSEITDYNNTTRKFDGQSDNGKELPTGTYFYKIEVTGKTLTGYLSLKR